MVRQDLEGPLVPSMKPMIQDLLGELLSLQLQHKIARRVVPRILYLLFSEWVGHVPEH